MIMISLQPKHKSYDSTVNLLNRQQEEGSYLVFLRGSATVGHYLTAGIFDNDGLSLTGVTINYQWQQSVNGHWTDIVGETAQSLTLTNSLLRQQVRVLASYIDALDRGKYVTSSGVTVAAQNAIVVENQKTGTTAWKISNLETLIRLSTHCNCIPRMYFRLQVTMNIGKWK
jgi:post-segregation antitoxin (ccd killing protein)